MRHKSPGNHSGFSRNTHRASPCSPLWICFGMCVILLATGSKRLSAQANQDWPEFLNNNMERWNPYETVLNVNNVENLAVEWTFSATDSAVTSGVAVVNGVVYFSTLSDSVYALKASTGAKLWRYHTGLSTYTTPAVMNGVLYFGSGDDNVYALDASTGAMLWRYPTGGSLSQSSPAAMNGVVYVGSSDYNVYALNASTGAKLWSYPTGGPVIDSPAVMSGVVYVGSSDSYIYALDATSGMDLWSFPTGGHVESSPAIANGVVYTGSDDNNLYALNASSGMELWSFPAGGHVTSSPAVANGVVYVGSSDDDIYALDATTGTELWSFPTGGPVTSSPAVANGVVYVPSQDCNLYALNATTGTKLWSYNTGYVVSTPAVSHGVVYVGVGDDPGKMYAFSIQNVSLVVEPNVKCTASLGPCSGNIVLANGSETTALSAIIKPPQALTVNLTTSFGTVNNISTGSSGYGTGTYTAGVLAFGWTDTQTSSGTVNGMIGTQPFPSLTQIFNYAAFNFHQSQVTDTEFTDTSAMSTTAIQSFMVNQDSFLSRLIVISSLGGFIDQNGNGQLDQGETVYVSNPAQECKAPCGPFPLGSTGTPAAGIFENAAVTYGVNPKILLTTAEKENSLITRSKIPSAGVLNFAMGCGKKSDFLSQLNCSADTLVYQFNQTPSEPFFLKQPSYNIQHNVAGMGLTKVAFQIQDAATYSQYRYTPFIQSKPTGGGVYLFEHLWSLFGF